MTDLKIAGINGKYNYFSWLLGQLLKLASWRKMNFDQALLCQYMNKVLSGTQGSYSTKIRKEVKSRGHKALKSGGFCGQAGLALMEVTKNS